MDGESIAAPLQIPGAGIPPRLHLHPGTDPISQAIRDHGVWEPFETSVFLALLRPGDTVVDVGANIGYYTVLAAQAVGTSGYVHAIEPDPDNLALLRDNVALNGFNNVLVHALAASDATGQAALHRDAANRGDHRLYQSRDEARPTVSVAIASLDALLAPPLFPPTAPPSGLRPPSPQQPGEGSARHDLATGFPSPGSWGEGLGMGATGPRLIKIDAQGSELAIFRGMAKLLARRTRDLRIITEIWPYGLREAGASHGELLALLRGYGFRLSLIDEAARRLEPVTYEVLEQRLATPWYAEQRGFVNMLLDGNEHGNPSGQTP